MHVFRAHFYRALSDEDEDPDEDEEYHLVIHPYSYMYSFYFVSLLGYQTARSSAVSWCPLCIAIVRASTPN